MKKRLIFFLLIPACLLAAAVLFFAVRSAAAGWAVERDAGILPAEAPRLEATHRLEIVPLYEEARAGDQFESGHGVSYLIRTDSAGILMDVGNNPDDSPVTPFLRNMQALGISWGEVDSLVISHRHPDHVGGLAVWKGHAVNGLAAVSGDLPVHVPVRGTCPSELLTSQPSLLSPDTATVGALPFREVFPLSLFGAKSREQALVVNLAGEGLVLITGCGHPGLQRLVHRAEGLYGLPVIGVVGGLHYGEADARAVASPIRFLQDRHPRLIALSPHDSGIEAIEAFKAAFPGAYQPLLVGATVVIESRK